MLQKLRELNPDVKLYCVTDEEFAPFGRVLDCDTAEIVSVGETVAMPEGASSYVPSEPKFECLEIADEICQNYFGEMPTQVGYCWGHSNKLNALEWHTSSEVNVAVTDLVLLLAPLCKFKNGTIDSKEVRGFYVPKGTAIEVYATSMHFCPIEVSHSGFGCVVALPKGTNTDLENSHGDKLLFRKNKWITCCMDNETLIGRGVVAGITGTNYEIKYK